MLSGALWALSNHSISEAILVADCVKNDLIGYSLLLACFGMAHTLHKQHAHLLDTVCIGRRIVRQLHILDGIVNDDLEPSVNSLRIAERRIDFAKSRFIYIDCSQTHSAIRFMFILPVKIRFFSI